MWRKKTGGRDMFALSPTMRRAGPAFFSRESSGAGCREHRGGEGGFGYDPILCLPERGCTAAELDLATKNAISHRGRALAAFRAWLAGELAKGGGEG